MARMTTKAQHDDGMAYFQASPSPAPPMTAEGIRQAVKSLGPPSTPITRWISPGRWIQARPGLGGGVEYRVVSVAESLRAWPAIALACLSLALAGCQAPTGSPSIGRARDATGEASDNVTRTKEAIVAALRDLGRIRQFTIAPGGTIIDGTVETLGAGGVAADSARKELAQVKTELVNAERDMAAKEKRYDDLRANRWVSVALWCQRAFWFAVGGWALLSVLALVSGLFNPLSAMGRVGGFAVGALRSVRALASCVSEPIAAARDAIAKRKAKP